MTITISDVLTDLRATALDARDKGDKFERLIQAYLKNDPEWTARFDDVWLWSEWPDRDGKPDTGIDIVARNREGDGLTAIQCKFYAPTHKVAKADIDSFISASAAEQFTQRIIFDTAAGWSGNAEATLHGVASRVDISYLGDAAIDWSQFSWTTPQVVVPTGKKSLRPHQKRALDEVSKGFAEHDRGKAIMACGTGKTFTSLKIAEQMVGEGGSVLFLVPSIQLLSQSLREWMSNSEVDIRPFAVCSDVRVGRKVASDDADISAIDLAEPATTDAKTLVARMKTGKYAKDRMTVVFSTYQSIDVISEAQKAGLGEFDLVICDEAHRTTGVTLAGNDDSSFVKVHDNQALQAKKRLYMTATPRVFGDDVRRKAGEADAVLADMGDESLFGPEFHRLGFGEAVEANLLTDYKVLVLAVDEQYVADNFQRAMSESGELKLNEAAKLVGCWNGLRKNFGAKSTGSDTNGAPMRTAVAFATDIKASKAATAAFPTMAARAALDVDGGVPLAVQTRHVDGTMGIHERNSHLAWLKEETAGDVCRILTNARCLSEGVDVPALDAVLFLAPRGSQVDVVQSVGRVMRRAPGKELGYIILPVVVPTGVAPEEALRDNERYKVVWQVLQALRSHDDRFHATVNQIELNKKKPPVIDIIPVTTPTDFDDPGTGDDSKNKAKHVQPTIEFPTDAFQDAMYAKIVQKVGERRYWETWAKDVADIAQAHITRIKGLLADPESNPAKEFAEFLDGLRGNLNDSISADEAIEMLAQHLITRPIFEALFDGYSFGENNPVASIMELMLASLDEHNLDDENETLEKFYDSVRRRVAGVDNAEGKQRILIELYDKFFATAFKKTVDKLGIVYTPVEIVDFILRSADEVLRSEFGQGLTDEGVHVLDGFTGTGTFLVRLLQSGLIEPHDLARKYAEELHGNEILLLAYYIAAVNIETTFQDLTGDSEPFPGLILTDTFQSWEPGDRLDNKVFPENNARLEALKKLPITVILGNPPYSAGQDSANDDNANEKYPSLDDEIRQTYAERSSATNKNSLYDSYIRAIKWGTLRLTDRGVIAYVTNGGFIDSNTADGLRKTVAEEFTSIHIYNLRGNARTAGDQRQKEGGTVFDAGSRATVAITLLVKNPDAKAGLATIHYTDIGDYLTREQKLVKVANAGSIIKLESASITPNEHGDWINQRRDDFETFMPIGDKVDRSMFVVYSGGLKTNRDSWCYNFSRAAVAANMATLVGTYASEVAARDANPQRARVADDTRISWNRSLIADYERSKPHQVRSEAFRVAAYRPFTRMTAYFDRSLNDMVYRLPRLYPTEKHPNVGFYYVGMGSAVPFSVLMLDAVPDLHVTGAGSGGQFFARWTWEPSTVGAGGFDFDDSQEEGAVDGYRRVDNITDQTHTQFRAAYPALEITKDDIFFYTYGLLHSPDYRTTYASDLKRMLPRIPFVEDFMAYAAAGRALSELHVGYESVEPFALTESISGDESAVDLFRVQKMAFGKGPRVDGKLTTDRTTVVYNAHITLSGIPEDAHRYMLGSRSAIEWILERYQVKTDKASGIINDPNDWATEHNEPRYIFDLLKRIVTVSVETMKIVDSLPALDIIE